MAPCRPAMRSSPAISSITFCKAMHRRALLADKSGFERLRAVGWLRQYSAHMHQPVQ